jgi:3-hydroxyacyl-CoA dehydrogenase/enoyl-CoA hydratase/3-hydroxybutyryl-CoA epimerase
VVKGNIGSNMGIVFPAQTGGVLKSNNAYGLPEFVARAQELAKRYGAVFEPPQLLLDRAKSGELFA